MVNTISPYLRKLCLVSGVKPDAKFSLLLSTPARGNLLRKNGDSAVPPLLEYIAKNESVSLEDFREVVDLQRSLESGDK